MHYGDLMDCSAGCINRNSICAFGNTNDLRILDASWLSADEKPLGIDQLCLLNSEGGDLASSCPNVYEQQIPAFYDSQVQDFVQISQERGNEQAAIFQACFF
jgi:hypothetical protein